MVAGQAIKPECFVEENPSTHPVPDNRACVCAPSFLALFEKQFSARSHPHMACHLTGEQPVKPSGSHPIILTAVFGRPSPLFIQPTIITSYLQARLCGCCSRPAADFATVSWRKRNTRKSARSRCEAYGPREGFTRRAHWLLSPELPVAVNRLRHSPLPLLPIRKTSPSQRLSPVALLATTDTIVAGVLCASISPDTRASHSGAATLLVQTTRIPNPITRRTTFATPIRS